MTTMTDDTYNGYSNRETWAFNLHWSNDQGLYELTVDLGREYLDRLSDETDAEVRDYGLGEHVVNYWDDYLSNYADEFGTPLPSGLAMFKDEVGSWWRIDYAEVGAAVREALDL